VARQFAERFDKGYPAQLALAVEWRAEKPYLPAHKSISLRARTWASLLYASGMFPSSPDNTCFRFHHLRNRWSPKKNSAVICRNRKEPRDG
jgi:hypothetical protein